MSKTRTWVLLLTVTILVGVTALSASPNFDPGRPEGSGLDRARDAVNGHTDRLLTLPLVTGVGLGATATGKPAIVVLAESADVNVPNSIDGVPVVVHVTGKIYALGGPPAASASFTFTCSGLACDFDGSGSTGRKLSFAWVFGDGAAGSGKIVSHMYGGAGTYAVTLTVTDKDGASSSTSQDVTIADGGGAGGGDIDCGVTGDTTVRCARPVPIGVSTGHPTVTAGTIGARVTDGTEVYALSNNHVYAATNSATLGDNVLQPGASDGGIDPDDTIGTLFAFKEILFDPDPNDNVPGPDNTIDAAIALSSTANLGNSTPSNGYGVPSSFTEAATVGMRVLKYGRTTGETKGRVGATNLTVNVNYGVGVARFVNQFAVFGGGFSAGGDSGSLVVTQRGGHKPAGLLFAGGVNATIMNPIGPVLSQFGVTVDGN